MKAEFIAVAEIIVRGTQEPSSGWYNSPDDLVSAIAGQLDAVDLTARGECAAIAREVRKELKRTAATKKLSQIDEHVAFVADSIAEKIEASGGPK